MVTWLQLKLCLDRLCAPLRPTDRHITIEGLDSCDELSGKGDIVLASVASGTITYTVAYTNEGDQSIGDPDIGLGLMIQDSVPDGSTYVEGSADLANELPPGVTDYTVLYSTNNGTSWLTSEPSGYTNVTDIQWWLSDALASNAGGVVKLSVVLADPYIAPAPIICNTSTLHIGSGPAFGTCKHRC